MFRSRSTQSPGRPVEHSGYRSPKLTTMLTILLLLLPYTVSFGDGGLSFTLMNSTSHYLHAMINGKPYLYIAPQCMVAVELSTYSGVVAEVAYSPGQGIKGKTSKTFEAVIHTTENANESGTCSSGSGGNTCSSNSATESTTSVSPITWTVEPSDLQSNELQGR